MNKRKKLLLVFLTIVLTLAFVTACSSAEPAPAAVEAPTESAPAVEQPAVEQPVKEPESPPAEKAPAEAPVEAPVEVKLADSQEPKEPSKPKQADATSLVIEGSGIKEPITLTLDELKAMTDAYYEDDYFSLNSYGTKEYFSFKGIKLSAVLENAGIKESAAALRFIASDGYEFEMTVEQALKEDYMDEQNPDKRYPVIIAWHENGKDYDASKGAPFRLVIGQKEPGDVNKPQWVQNIAKITVN